MATRKSATKNGFLIFTDQLTLFENIPDESIGKAIKLLLKNFDHMQPIQEEPFTNMAYELIATNIRRYREEQELASMFGKRGGNPNLNPTLKGTLNNTDNSTHKQQDKTRQDNTKQEIIDLYINKYRDYFEKEYKRVFKNKPFLSQQDCHKIIELSQQYDEITITEAIERLKNISFADINFKPTASWLLKDNNFERVMNGEFDRQEESLTEFLNEWAKKGADNEC